MRFLKVWKQTIGSQVTEALLYVTIFGAALGSRIVEIDGISYLLFIVPGIIIFKSLINAFQSPASSLLISKYHHCLSDILSTTLTPLEKTLGYALGGVARGLMIGLTTWATVWIIKPDVVPLYMGSFLLILLLGNMIFAIVGTFAGLWCKTFDDHNAISQMIVTPLAMLGGVFYSLNTLPLWAQILSLLNPFVYIVDGARWAFLGQGVLPWTTDLSIMMVLLLGSGYICWLAFRYNWWLAD